MNKSERTAVLTAIKTSSTMQALYFNLQDREKETFYLGEVSALCRVCKRFEIDCESALAEGKVAGEQMFKDGAFAVHA